MVVDEFLLDRPVIAFNTAVDFRAAGIDKQTGVISADIAKAGRGEAIYCGMIESTPQSGVKLAKKFSTYGENALFCYEAGPCGQEKY